MTKISLILLLIFITFKAYSLEKCEWDNRAGIPCIAVSKTSNTSVHNYNSVNKKVITKKMIRDSGTKDALDVLKLVTGIDYYQSGQKGQTGAIFMRGSESNHTLVLLNGIPINDQSATNGIHDFGQDFIQTVQQVEIFKGSNGAHFGPDAIGGAINFITDIDYQNSYSINGFNYKNNSLDGNFTKITDNGWHLNAKVATNISETDSAIAKGIENDGTKNYQINLNLNKWINDNLKFKSVVYSRDTKSDYDKSASREESVFADNQMYAIQNSFEKVSKFSSSYITMHYHNYDRVYKEQGKTDTYFSESLVAKAESEHEISNKISFGYGADYKYDWGNFSTTTLTSQTKGHVKNFGLFSNLAYLINDKQLLSLHVRNDDHKQTGGNQTYKFNFTQSLDNLKLGVTHSTGLKNPSLYELYGSSGFGHNGNLNINPEKSETNEIFVDYKLTDNLNFYSTAYRTRMKDRIKVNSSWTAYENKILDTTQEGLESELVFNGNNQSISILSHFAKSRTDTNEPNSRRPDLYYGVNYSKKINTSDYGLFNLNLYYRYIGDHLDWTGSKNEFVKSVDLLNMSINKDWYDLNLSLNISNLLNERYEKPATYTQDGRQLSFGLRRSF
jgi:vitamin B12 transporter